MSSDNGLFDLAAGYAARFHDSLDTRPVGATASFDDICASLGGPLPDEGSDLSLIHI